MEISADILKERAKGKICEETVKRLLKENKKITFAESCTGGYLAKMLTDVPGASGCFDGSFVTYSNDQKMRLLSVKNDTLKEYGAVSYQTALEMSEGVKKSFGADVGVGVTGIAGPGGGTKDKPVGLVYISVCTDKMHFYSKLNLKGTREEVRNLTCMYVFSVVLYALDN